MENQTKKQTSTERVRAMREKRKALGLCRDCGAPIEPDDDPAKGAGRKRTSRCRVCAEKHLR